MMTKEDYELRLAVAKEMRELAANITPVAVELADLAINALNEQWERAQANVPWGYARSYTSGKLGVCWELCAENEAEVTLFVHKPDVKELLADRARLEWLIRQGEYEPTPELYTAARAEIDNAMKG